ncbi:MAG: ABC transporter ATP-binding protein [Thermoanaerobaculia bacterium]
MSALAAPDLSAPAPLLSAPAVSVERLSKVYRVHSNPMNRAMELLTRRPRHRAFHALDEVSFEVPAGQGFGIIGENGAGKSTLLKILSGITAPSSGSLAVRGKVASILELGSAFHPELSGRQNIVLNAALLGLSESAIRDKTPQIIAFSELESFIDQPVKTYSTGMAMRLGFAIATQVEPDVLIIDEALSVGDGYFQKKCIDRLQEFTSGGGTLLLCSHAMYYVSAFCAQALWLQNGKVAACGPSQDVVRKYEEFLLAKAGTSHAEDALVPGPARLTDVRLPGGALARQGETMTIEIEWKSDDPGLEFQVGVGLNRIDGVEVCSFTTLREGRRPYSGRRSYSVRLEVPDLQILKGRFTIYAFLLDGAGLHIFDRQILADAFGVESPRYAIGLAQFPHRWSDEGATAIAASTEASLHV